MLQEHSKVSRLYALLTGYDYNHIYSVGIITAENPMGEKYNNKENKERMRELKRYLGDSNFVYLQALGKYGNFENSLIVQNVTYDFMKEVAILFEQEAFIYGQLYESKDKHGMKFEYFQQGTFEKIVKDVDYGKIVKQVPDNKFKLISTRYSYVKKSDAKDYYTEFKGIKFKIPFFDSEYDDIIVEKEIGFSLLNSIVENVDIKQLLERVERLREGKNKTKKWQWENRGVVKLMLHGEFGG